MTDISDCVNVINWCFIIIWSENFSVFRNFDSNILKSNFFGLSTSSNGEQYSIIDILNLIISLFEGDNLSALRIKFNTGGDSLFDEFNSCFFHIITDFIGQLLVKASQKDRSDHNSNMASKSMQESSALQSYIAGADN